jgi:hypothetical protein
MLYDWLALVELIIHTHMDKQRTELPLRMRIRWAEVNFLFVANRDEMEKCFLAVYLFTLPNIHLSIILFVHIVPQEELYRYLRA